MSSLDAPDDTFTPTDFKQLFSNLYDRKPLDSGHFGDTYSASLRVPGKPPLKVVCKVPKTADDDRREVQTLINLEPHPLVVKLVGVCHDWDGSQTAMIFEYHPGGNLKSYVEAKFPDGSEMDLDELYSFAYHMACSIRHLHSNGVLHRDIALRNFVLSREGVPVVIDFGLSRQVPEYSSTSSTAIPWKQMPPESIDGKMRLSTQKSDVYSLGIAFWRLFHQAKPPFPHVRSHIELLQMLHVAGAKAPPHLASAPLQFANAVPPSMRALIERMCAISMEDRPPVSEVCDVLERYLSPVVLRKAQAVIGVPNEYNNVDDILEHTRTSMGVLPPRSLDKDTHAAHEQRQKTNPFTASRNPKTDIRTHASLKEDNDAQKKRIEDVECPIKLAGFRAEFGWPSGETKESPSSRDKARAISETMHHEDEIKSTELPPTPRRLEDAYPEDKRVSSAESMNEASSFEGSPMASSSFASSSAVGTSDASISLEAQVERDEEITSSELLQAPIRGEDDIAKDFEPSMSERGKGLDEELHGVGFEDRAAVVRKLRTNCFDRESLCGITDEQLRDMFPAHGTYNRMKQYLKNLQKASEPSMSAVSRDLLSQLQPLMFKNVRQVVRTLRDNDLDTNLLQHCTDQMLSGMFAAPGTFLKMQEFIELLREEKRMRRRLRRSPTTVLNLWQYRARSLTGSMSALHLAARDGDLAVVENIIANGRVDLNATDEQDRTPLFVAASYGRRAVVQVLMKQQGRVDASVCNTCNETPLMAALRNENVDVALDLLHTPGASLNIDAIAVGDHETALGIASRNGNLRVVRLLLQRHVDAKVQNSDGDTPLIAALRKEHVDVALELLHAPDAPLNIDASAAGDKETALGIASRNGNLRVVRLLLQRHVDVKVQNSDGDTPLIAALRNKHADVAREILQASDVNIRTDAVSEDAGMYSSLLQALMLSDGVDLHMHEEGTSQILLSNFSKKVSDAHGNTGILALVTMPERIGLAILHVLLTAMSVDFELNRKTLQGETALMFALRERRYKLVKKLLLIENIDCSSKDERTRNTVLHEAVLHPDEEIVDMILNVKLRPVDINARNLPGETALKITLTNEEASRYAMRLLKVKDVDLTISTIVGDCQTALHLATKLRDRELSVSVINRLLSDFSHKLDANVINHLGRTPLMEAAREQNIPAMERLLSDQNVDSSLVDREGNTLLHFTVLSPKNHLVKMLDFLLEVSNTTAAVDNAKNHTTVAVNAKNHKGDTALLLALQSKHNENEYVTPKRLFDDERVDLNVTNNEGNNALHLAVMMNNRAASAKFVKLLLSSDRFTEINAQNRNGDSPFLLSLKSMINHRGFEEPIWKLFFRDERVDINVVNTEGNTALHLAAMITDKRRRDDTVYHLTRMNDTRRKFGYFTENRAGRTPLDIQKNSFTQDD